MSLASMAITVASKGSAKRFEQATLDPVGVQRAKLLEMLARNADTEYGRRYSFGEIKTPQEYAGRVPVVTYENIKDDVERVVAGESNILTKEDPVMFARTSGTTGDAKYVPVTPTCQGTEHKDVMRTWLYHAQQAHRDIFKGKCVSLVSPAIEGYASSGIPFGSTSGHIYKNMPGFVRRAYAIPYDVFEMADYNAKYYAIMRISLEQDVRFLCTANPSSILKMCEKANEFSEQIIRDIRDGTLWAECNVEAPIRQKLESTFRPNPRRAKLLEDARSARKGELLPADYWPRLSLIGCWKGGTVGHYLERFPRLFDPDERRDIPVRDWGYLSSEARGSVPLSDMGSSGVLTISTNYYEFVAVDELEASVDNSSKWTFLAVGEIEVGAEYYIFVTTSGGLYRYDINDVVQIVGYYNRAPEIVFLRKGRGMTNITGEKVSVNQIISAFQDASRETGILPDHYKAEADVEKSRYVFKVEFGRPTDAPARASFLRQLDDNLQRINIEYKAKRDSLRLGAPILHVMRDGWYERQRRKQAESGKRVFQAKTVVLEPAKLMAAKDSELEAVIELGE